MTNMMKATRRLIAGASAAGLSIVLSGCGGVTAALNPRPTNFVLAFFDVSGTTKAVRNSYLRDANSTIGQLQAGDSLWADQITENTLATSRVPMQVNLPTLNILSQNKDDYDDQLAAMKSQARTDVQALLNGNTSKTAILDSLLLAQKLFHGSCATAASRRVLVLFSDMLEDSNRYRFDRETLTPARIKQIIAREQADHRIADLKGVEVYVAGATADPSGDPAQIGRIQAFWLAYFQAAGAELADAHYSASLLDFTLTGSYKK
jgi:hypothetical protein